MAPKEDLQNYYATLKPCVQEGEGITHGSHVATTNTLFLLHKI